MYDLEKDLYRAFKGMGLPDHVALRAAGGREHRFLKESDVTPTLDEQQTEYQEILQHLGLSEAAARQAALENLGKTVEETDPATLAHARQVIREAEEVLAEMQTLVEARKSTGKGSGVGGQHTPEEIQAATEFWLENSFRSMGLSESVAKAAAKGR